MTREEYIRFHKECTKFMLDVAMAKSFDYSGGDSDIFSNFTAVEKLDICSTEKAFLVRMLDKFNRLSSFTKQGKLEVKSESVSDTLLDLSNYCILFAAYLESKYEHNES